MIIGKLVQLDTLNNTRSGNPRYRAHIETDHGVIILLTRGDTTFSYQIKNYLNKENQHWLVSGGLILGVTDR
jgi:hypothetical protein